MTGVEIKGTTTPAPDDGTLFVLGADGSLVAKEKGRPDKSGTFRVNPAKKPREIDFVLAAEKGEEAGARLMKAIYELDGNTLRLGIPVGGDPATARLGGFDAADACIWHLKHLQAGNDAADKELERLQGEWVATAFEMNGERLTADDLKKSPITYRFQKSKLVVPSIKGERGGEFAFEVRLDPDKSPKRLDMKALEPSLKGGVQLAIYRLDGEDLTLCIPPPSATEPPAKFEAPAKSELLLITFRRAKK